MNKMLVAVFDNENKAFEGLRALNDLHGNGDITLYATAVISKDEKGELRLNTAADQGPVGIATGLFTGSLIGLLGGPIGFAIGGIAGALAGLAFDASSDDINTTFVDEVSNALAKNKTAIIAEIDESWEIPVNTSLEALNAMVFRRLRYEVAEDQLNRESEAIAAEYRNLKEELKEARGEDRKAIESAIEKLQNKAQAINDQLKRKLSESKDQFNAKVDSMHQQMKDVRNRRKKKIEERIDEVKQEYRIRREKLKQASKLIDEAIGPKGHIEESETAGVH